MGQPSTIAIDGPAGSGKTTLGRRVAQILGYRYIDTGVMYRAVTLLALRQNVPVAEHFSIAVIASNLEIDFLTEITNGYFTRILLAGEDVTGKLDTLEVDAHVSAVAAISGVRTALVNLQRAIADSGNVVMVGRDIGTVVLNDADIKFYIDAAVEVRARRRWIEYAGTNVETSYDDILEGMRARDRVDSSRVHSPLTRASDAILIDTSEMDPDEMVRTAIDHIKTWKIREAPQ